MKIINSNILQAKSGIICHGVNCQKVMGAGLAKEIKKAYPEIYTSFKSFKPGLGQIDIIEIGSFVEEKPPLYIANCYTQFYYGRMKPYKDATQHFDYDAFEIICNTLFTFASQNNLDIHWPKIGCGLAGGKWSQVKKIIEKCEKEYSWEKNYLWLARKSV